MLRAEGEKEQRRQERKIKRRECKAPSRGKVDEERRRRGKRRGLMVTRGRGSALPVVTLAKDWEEEGGNIFGENRRGKGAGGLKGLEGIHQKSTKDAAGVRGEFRAKGGPKLFVGHHMIDTERRNPRGRPTRQIA